MTDSKDTAARFQNRLAKLIDANHGSDAVTEAVKAVAGNTVSIQSLYLDILSPLLIETGTSWQEGTTKVWQEHLRSALIRSIIESLALEVARRAPVPDPKRIVVLACPPEEQHDLWLRMLADLFRLDGWEAYFLGADTPADEIIDAARSLNATTIVINAATHFNRLRMRSMLEEMRKALPDTKIWITGSAFRFEQKGWPENEMLDPERFRPKG